MGYDAYVNFGVKVPEGMAETIQNDLVEHLYRNDCDDFDLETDVTKVYGRMHLFSEDPEKVAQAFQVFADKYQITFAIDYDDEQEDTLRFYVGKDKALEEAKDHWVTLTKAIIALLDNEEVAVQAFQEIEADPTGHGLHPDMIRVINEFRDE